MEPIDKIVEEMETKIMAQEEELILLDQWVTIDLNRTSQRLCKGLRFRQAE